MCADTPEYKDTLNLPQTDFPMRAGLPKREPEWLQRWSDLQLYTRLRDKAKTEDRTPFTLHDGPPYANGHLHIGHALNKILKDMVVRSQQMMGRDARYIPGWDCHGLPIEWKIEEQYRAKGRNKDDVDIVDFRQECRKFAEGWIDIQREEFKRLGVTGKWSKPYLTMDFRAETDHRRGVPEIPDDRDALSGVQAGDVVAGGTDRFGRGRGRVSRQGKLHHLGEVSCGATKGDLHGRKCGHLDHHALDDPVQQGGRLWRELRLWPLRGHRDARGMLGAQWVTGSCLPISWPQMSSPAPGWRMACGPASAM